MYQIIGNNGSGKTKKLMLLAQEHNGVFVCANPHAMKEKAKAYDELQSNILSAAARGYVDLVIDPADTRKYLISAFEMLYSKKVSDVYKKHGTV